MHIADLTINSLLLYNYCSEWYQNNDEIIFLFMHTMKGMYNKSIGEIIIEFFLQAATVQSVT